MCIWVTYLKLDLRESKMGWWKPLLCLQRNISIWLTLSRLWLQRDWGYSSNHTLYEHHVTHECPYWCLTLFVKASIQAQMAHGASSLVSFSMKRLGVLLPPLDGMLVHRRITPSIFAVTYLYTWTKRSTVRVKCFAWEHNAMTLARAWTQTTQSRVERTNCEANASPLLFVCMH